MVKREELKQILNLIKDRSLREKTSEITNNPRIEIAGKLYSGVSIETSPAGLSRHHGYPGGFIDHIVATSKIALALCDVIKKVYGGKVNRDFVVAGIILHDIFKPLTYETDGKGYSISHLGEHVDHLSLITAELIRREFPLDLVHIVCAHHGGQAGPTWPRTVEALICHLADQADSQLNGQVIRAARTLLRRAAGEELILITSKEAFEIIYSKKAEGIKGVIKALRKIERRRKSRK
jgi:7,8-dihydroneopterin 2',3'-cyclic phosphate phosphodiesterase